MARSEEQNETYLRVLKNVVDNIRVLKRVKGYKTIQLAEATNYAPSYLSEHLSPKKVGNKGMTLEFIVALANALGTTPGKLIDSKPPMSENEYAKSHLLSES